MPLNWSSKRPFLKFSDLHYIRNYPVSVLARKALSYPFRKFRDGKMKERWMGKGIATEPTDEGCLERKLQGVLHEVQEVGSEKGEFLLEAFLSQHFDILGSGWLYWGTDGVPSGIEGVILDDPNSQGGKDQGSDSGVRRRIVNPDHRRIAWNKDLKSGFSWPSDQWAKDASKAHHGVWGADPKVPMELGRMQHLPRIPWIVKALGKDPAPYVRAFHDQVIDFFASSPPGRGIHWVYSMDVGLRIMNLLMAWDLFKEIDEEGFLEREGFDELLYGAIRLHARYIMDRPEYQDGLTGNHYLFNVLGLLFAGAYSAQSEEGDEQLAYSIPELIRELFKQFHPDGMNFEGSTAYHRFATEGMIWGAALLLGNKERLRKMEWEKEVELSKWTLGENHSPLMSTAEHPLPAPFFNRLFKASELMQALGKADQRFPQIGDNDSGRAFRFTPVGDMLHPEELKARYEGRGDQEGVRGSDRVFDEDQLEVGSFYALAKGFFDQEWQEEDATKELFEQRLIRALKRSEPLRVEGTELKEGFGKDPTLSEENFEKRTELLFPVRVDLEKGSWSIREWSGIHLFRSPELHLTISAWPGSDRIRHTMGHVHCDRLSFELQVKGEDLVVDPGSYIYGAIPEERDRFRRSEVHNVPKVEGKEQMWWSKSSKGLFFARSDARCWVLYQKGGELALAMRYRGVYHERIFCLEPDRLLLIDRSDHPFSVFLNQGEPHSLGYGKKLKGRK